MQIEFNTNRIAKRDSSQPVAQRAATSSASDTASFADSASLQAKLNDLTTVRPEKVDQAKSLLANPNYPPADLLDRIATLLAVKQIK